MHNDGMVYFPIEGSERGLLVVNHEYTDDGLLFRDGTANWTAAKTRKSMHAHGVSVLEIVRQRDSDRLGAWQIDRTSRYARRITALTRMRIGGPLARTGQPTADPRMVTSSDETGREVIGTLNNCAIGRTPWGTFLTCEENFTDYFTKTGPPTDVERRYGIPETRFLWHTTDRRFRVDEEPHEPSKFGWVVEFDPFDPASVPVKRTALGRIKHEGAWVQEARDGRVVVYMGDDEQFEYIYRYVSSRRWRDMIRDGVNPLDEGVLYAAKFLPTHGEWLPLSPDNPLLRGWSLNDILLNTRGAADRAGATKMDRPEWIVTFPNSLTAIGALTNNARRGVDTNPGVDAANPRTGNSYGHIIRWSCERDFTDPTFRWDIVASCGDPKNPAHRATIQGDPFSSPDGLYVTPSGRLWIQTDVSTALLNTGEYVVFGNNQMLCADMATKEVRRFLVGPRRCEVTGVVVTPDERTMFLAIQHPGETPTLAPNDPANPKRFSSWPDGAAGGRPRSACVVITKDDGGVIGT
jgi:secreted PhoX family phosphatase